VTRVEKELEQIKHDQDLPEVQRAAEAARERDRQRMEQEQDAEFEHESPVKAHS